MAQMHLIYSNEALSKLFTDAGYNVDDKMAGTLNDYIEDAGYQLATDQNNIFKIKYATMKVEKTQLREIINFVENFADEMLNRDVLSRDEENTIRKDLSSIRKLYDSPTRKYFNYLMEHNISRNSLPGEFAHAYREAVNTYGDEINPELNYEFFTRKSIEKMLVSGKQPIDNIRNVVSIYAPERALKSREYVDNIIMDLKQKLLPVPEAKKAKSIQK